VTNSNKKGLKEEGTLASRRIARAHRENIEEGEPVGRFSILESVGGPQRKCGGRKAREKREKKFDKGRRCLTIVKGMRWGQNYSYLRGEPLSKIREWSW